MDKNVIARYALACLMLSAWGGELGAAGDPAAGKTKSAACAACHGADGNSPAPTWPKLAGQVREYTVKQLHDFKAGRRTEPTMSPMVQPLSSQDMEDIAAYLATQRIEPGAGKPELRALGEKIYEKGKHRPAVTACTGCHGANGAGNGEWAKRLAAPPAVLAPALAGQHPDYIVKQLKAYQSGVRRNDVGGVMRDIASRLTEEEIVAVAHFVTTLRSRR